MRIRNLAALGVLAAIAACGGGGDAMESSGAGAADADGWVTLFDGSGTDGWDITGDANWSIADNAVGADSGSGMLVTPRTYGNFEIELEFWVDVPANSGVFARCQDPQNIGAENCYEVNIFDTRADQTYRTGSIVNFASPDIFMYTGGRWNRYHITMNGAHLQVELNGETTVDVMDSTFADGYIGLQYGAGVVRFRNVRIREL